MRLPFVGTSQPEFPNFIITVIIINFTSRSNSCLLEESHMTLANSFMKERKTKIPVSNMTAEDCRENQRY